MALTLTARHVSANQNEGAIIRNFEAGAALTIGQAVYIDSNGKAQLADANGASESIARAAGVVVQAPNMYGETAIASGDRCSVCVFGPVHGFSGLTPNSVVWVGATAGALVETAPTSPAYQFAIGYAAQADILFVNPEADAAYSV